jgi:excisionase family DNA binding protein
LIDAGQLPTYRAGRVIKVRLEDLEAYLHAKRF